MAETTVTAKILADVTGFATGMRKATDSLSKFSSVATRAGRDISTSISAPLILLGREALKIATSFDLAQRKIQGIRGADAPIEKLSKTARALGASTIFTAEEVSNLQLSLAKLGKSDAEILGLQGAVLKLAQAMDMDLAAAGELVIKNQNRFKESLSELGGTLEQSEQIANVFTKATQESALTAETLGTALNYAGAEASSYGLSIEQTVALLALLSERGYEASRGGTALRRVLSLLAKEGLSANEAIEELFAGTSSFEEALKRFGIRGAGAASSLGGLRDEFDQLVKKLEESQGTTDKFADALDESLFATLKRLASALADFAIEIENLFGQGFKDFINSITELVRGLSALDNQTKRNIALTLTFFAALGPLLLIIGGVTSAIAFFGRAISGVILRFGKLSKLIKSFATGLGLLPRAWFAQASAARASAAATGTAAAAAGTATKAFTVLRTALKRIGWFFAIEGIIAFIDKVIQARGEAERLSEVISQNAAIELKVKTELKSLEELDFSEVERRLRNGAAQLTISFIEGVTPVNTDQIAERLVPVDIAKKIQERASSLINSGVELFGADPFTVAINEYLAAAKKKREEQEREHKINDGVITNLDLLLDRYDALTLAIFNFKKSALAGEDLDFEELELLEDELSRINSQLKQLGVYNLATFNDIGRQVDLGWIDLTNQFLEELPVKLEAATIPTTEIAPKIQGATESVLSGVFSEASQLLIFLEKTGEGFNNMTRWVSYATESVGKMIDELNREDLLNRMLELESVAKGIGSVFEQAFQTALDGTESLAKSIKTTLTEAIKSLIARLAGLAVAWGIVALLATIATGGSNLGSAATAIKSQGFVNFALQDFGLGSFQRSASEGNDLRVQGVLSGSDVVLTSRRGATALDRIYG